MDDEREKSYKVTYLSDLSIEQLAEDEFGHAEVADVLKEIVCDCPMPFTIGLFGGWGTGKTTISNFLKTGKRKDFYRRFP